MVYDAYDKMFKKQLIGDEGWTCQGGVNVGTKGAPVKGESFWGLRVDPLRGSVSEK